MFLKIHIAVLSGLKEVGYSIDEAQDMIHDERNTQEKASETRSPEISPEIIAGSMSEQTLTIKI